MASGLLQHADSLAQEAPDTDYYLARATPSTSAVEGMTEGDFAAEFRREPFEALRTLRVFVEFDLVARVNATKWLFPILIQARGDLRERVYELLLRLEEPDAILNAALTEYYAYGNEERLALAASLLADIGAPALPALRVFARSNSPECEMFVPVMAHLRGVSVQSRLDLLAHVASNASTDVRYSLLGALRAFSPDEIIPLLRALSRDRDKDEDVVEEARAWLETLKAESPKS